MIHSSELRNHAASIVEHMIKGFVEALRPFQVRGWVSDHAKPDTRLRVRVQVQGRSVGTGTADLFREDLLAARIGDGRYGFIINVTEALPLQDPASILVEAVGDDGRTHRLPASSSMAIDTVEVHAAESSVETSITGYFAVGSAEIRGWTYDAATPDRHLDVVVEIDGRRVGRTSANLFKDDLVLAGIGIGDHGFVVPALGSELLFNAGKIRALAVSPDGRFVPLGVAVKPSAPLAAPQGPAFPGRFVDAEQSPVIILGAARSGTSAIAQALTGSGAYAGFEEGHLLDLLTPLLKTTAQFYQSRSEEWSARRSTHLAAVPQSFIEQGLKHVILQAARQTFPEGRWLDKTPRAGMIAAAPLLRSIWPNARFIYMRRRAIENLDSRFRKFPTLDFEAHCQEWALSVRSWYAVTDALSGAALEIDQVYMAMNPAKVASALRDFLQLPDNVVDRLTQTLALDQPERTASSFGAIIDLDSLPWSASQVEIFKSVCGPAMRRAGYGDGTTYFLRGETTNGLVSR